MAAAIAVMALLLAAAVHVQAERERRYPVQTNRADSLAVASSAMVRRLAVAYAPLAADVYWIRALQYYGGTKVRLTAPETGPLPPLVLAGDTDALYPSLYPLLDVTTSLDPDFTVVYRFGAVFLAEPYPNGPGRPDLAVALLEKGLRTRPNRWEFMQDIGFVDYWYRQDYLAAAAWFGKASLAPDAPGWLKSLAATTVARGGDREASRRMWTAIRESADVDWLKRDAERRLVQLRALDEIDHLQARVAEAVKQSGRQTTTWQELAVSGIVPGVMVDPAGTPYELTPEGTVRLSSNSPLWPLPAEPKPAGSRPGA
jgi:hypothetical protein